MHHGCQRRQLARHTSPGATPPATSLWLPADSETPRIGRRQSELSIAAHAELLAAQLLDGTAGAVVIDANTSTLAGSGNTWHSTNTSSSSQTFATQRLTRLDTAAWQIDYNELKFSRVIGEGSFG